MSDIFQVCQCGHAVLLHYSGMKAPPGVCTFDGCDCRHYRKQILSKDEKRQQLEEISIPRMQRRMRPAPISSEELSAEIESIATRVVALLQPADGSEWRHYKGGVVQVICTAKEEATLRLVVVYRNTRKAQQIWTRPLQEFMDGRFTKI